MTPTLTNRYSDLDFGDLVAHGVVSAPLPARWGDPLVSLPGPGDLEVTAEGCLRRGGSALTGSFFLALRRPDGRLAFVPFMRGRIEADPTRWRLGPEPEPEDDAEPEGDDLATYDPEDWSRPLGAGGETPELIAVSDEWAGQVWPLAELPQTLAFNAAHQPRLLPASSQDPGVVAELSRRGERVELRGLPCGRPLLHNGRRLSSRPRVLRHGDVLAFGRAILLVSLGGEEPLLDHEFELALMI